MHVQPPPWQQFAYDVALAVIWFITGDRLYEIFSFSHELANRGPIERAFRSARHRGKDPNGPADLVPIPVELFPSLFSRTTKYRRPFSLLHVEEFENRDKAYAREKF